jgi:hypothetical protein
MTSHALADALTAHIRALRGFVWATGGYHTAGNGLWLSAAYYGNGLFLVDASRNGNQRNDLDALMEAFRLRVIAPADPRMLDPALYTAEVVYLNMTQPITPVLHKQDLLGSPRCSRSKRGQGYQRVTILEFVPLAHAPLAAAQGACVSGPSQLRLDGICPECGAEIKERPLFSGTFTGCLC